MLSQFLHDCRLVEQARDLLAGAGRVHVLDALEPKAADALHQAFQSVEWLLSAGGPQGHYNLSRDALGGLDAPTRQAFIADVHARARIGFQYMFETYRISDDVEAGRLTEGPFADFYRYLNSSSGLAWLRGVTGDERIAYVDA